MLKKVISQRQIVQTAIQESSERIRRSTHYRLFVHVEAGVNETRKACQLPIFIHNFVVARICSFINELWSSSTVHMNYSGTMFSHPIRTPKGNRHKLCRIPRAIQVFIALVSELF